jgi:hypothetical protein
MARIKKYKPHCPAPNCRGGYEHRLKKVEGMPEWIPPEILKLKKETEQLYRCNYCGFVWFQDNSKQKGFDPKPLGFFDSIFSPGFVLVDKSYRIRKENTSFSI